MTSPPPPGTATAALVAGVVGALALPGGPPGVGVPLTGVAVLAAAGHAARHRLGAAELGLGALAVALLGVAAVRDAGWLVAVCLLAATGAASYALAGGRSWAAVVLAGATGPLAGLRVPAWALLGLARAESRRPAWSAPARGAVLAGVLVVVFGALFAGADPVFAALVDDLLPDLSLDRLPAQAAAFVVATAIAVTARLVAVAPPSWDALDPPPGRPASRAQWLLPVAALDLLFLAFLAVQAAALTGGREHVLARTGLTFAEYARQGFAQLLAATVLTLVVVAVAGRTAPRRDARDRALARALLGVLCGSCLLVVASALARLRLYEAEFGSTVPRVVAAAVEGWLGVVLVLVLAAVVTGRSGALPRAVAGSGLVAVLLLAAADPELVVAARNVSRWERTGAVDTGHLSTLSADAVPALDRLPEPLRSEALACVAERLDRSGVDRDPPGWSTLDPLPLDPDELDRDHSWGSVNASRARARTVLADRPVLPTPGAGCWSG